MREHKLNKIHISDFRRFSSFELELRPFMVLIGANGVGKTSFLDAVEEQYRESISISRYHIIDVSQHAPVRLPQEMKPTISPGQNGEDLVPYLYNLRENESDRFETLIDTLVVNYLNFDSIDFTHIVDNKLSLLWNNKNSKQPVNICELSDGTVRYLWLLSLLYNPQMSAITMIDEPEISIHPEVLSMLVDVMREASMSTQLIVTTHSDRIVRHLKPEEVVVMDINEAGCAVATWADSLDLAHWLDEFGLDEIWRMGVIGGRA